MKLTSITYLVVYTFIYDLDRAAVDYCASSKVDRAVFLFRTEYEEVDLVLFLVCYLYDVKNLVGTLLRVFFRVDCWNLE